MVCPNCKHELNPQARVCPTCGTPVPGAPTVVITPPMQGSPSSIRRQGVTAARVFTIIFTILAMAMNGGLIAFWFLESVTVTAPDSVASYSMYEICRDVAPYLTYIVVAACALSIIFCLFPLFKKFADKRIRFIIPKLMAIVCGACYAVPYVGTKLVKAISAAVKGGDVAHNNPFTTICFWLFVLLIVMGELTSRNRYLVQRGRADTLRSQLEAYGIKPEV